MPSSRAPRAGRGSLRGWSAWSSVSPPSPCRTSAWPSAGDGRWSPARPATTVSRVRGSASPATSSPSTSRSSSTTVRRSPRSPASCATGYPASCDGTPACTRPRSTSRSSTCTGRTPTRGTAEGERRSRGRVDVLVRTAPAGRGVRSVGEGADAGAQVGRHPGELVDGGAGLGQRLGGGLRGRGDPRDVAGDLGGPAGGLLHRPRHLVGGGGLLLHRRGDGGLPVGDLRDDRADLLDRRDGGGGVALDGLHPPGDVLGRLRRLLRQFLHLVGHDREALAGLPGPRRLDR